MKKMKWMHTPKTFFTEIIFVAVVVILFSSRITMAQEYVVTYPASAHLQADAGTIEFWFRLEATPDPVDGEGKKHYFPFWCIKKPGEVHPRMKFFYGAIWKPENFHFAFLSSGKLQDKPADNPYVVTYEDTQPAVKGDRPGNLLPRIARLKKNEWHHLAFTWTGQPTSTVSLYLDGKQCILPTLLTVPLWDDVSSFEFTLMTMTYADNATIDDLRISSIARTEKELQESAAAPTLKADRFTLLIDRFEELETRGDKIFTKPEIFTKEGDATGGLVVLPSKAVLAEGKSGKGLKLLK